MNPTPAALILFCRRPQPGVGKQRIAARLGAEFAAGLGERLLASALEDAAGWPGPVVIAPAEAADTNWAARLLAREAQVLPQPGGNLGDRLNALDTMLRAAGHQRLLFMGSDAPGLTAGLYAQARAALDEADAVLAGARDGGVTLMGSRRPWPMLRDLPWSTAQLGETLRATLTDQGFSVRWLDGGYDVDETGDLASLADDLAGDPRPARQALRAWLVLQGFPGRNGCSRGYHNTSRLQPLPQREVAAGSPVEVSVVVPVYRDNDALAVLLAQLRKLAPFEVVVVDGAEDPDCRRLCEQEGVRWSAVLPGRGHQLDAGARLARGEVLWFLHADAGPPVDALAAIHAALGDPGVVGGWFRFRFAGTDRWPRRLLAGLINWRSRFGIAYGDQGLFMRREAYRSAGGFPDQPLFEEVPLLRALRRQGKLARLETSIGVSPRRWERDGWLRRSLANRALALAYMLGVPPRRLAAWYGRTEQDGK